MKTTLSHMSAAEVELFVYWSRQYSYRYVCAAYGGIDRQQIYRARALVAASVNPSA